MKTPARPSLQPRPRPARRPGRPRRMPLVEPLEGRLLLASINEFGAAAGLVGPTAIVAGPDGNLWFGQSNGVIGRITTGGQITQFSAGISDAPIIAGIAAGPDGNLWFTEYDTDRIGRISPQGVVTEFDLPFTASISKNPAGITAGPDGNLWFTEQNANAIGRITPDGVITEFQQFDVQYTPTAIVAGPDGNLWFTNVARDSIGRISTQGVFLSETSTGISPEAGLGDLTFRTDAAASTLYVTESDLGSIGVGAAADLGAVAEFSTGNQGGRPAGITVGPDGRVYFVEARGNNVVRIGDPAGPATLTRFPLPTAAQTPLAITAGPDGNLWFAEYGDFETGDGGRIGQLVLPTGIAPISGSNLEVFAGQSAPRIYATFGTLSTATVPANFLATIDFGDGTTGAGTIVQAGPGQFSVVASHAYPAAGTYVATITIATDAGPAVPVTSVVLAVPSFSVTGANPSAIATAPLAATFATFTDLVTGTTAADFTATIDFGDGTAGNGTIREVAPGQYAVDATHTYFAAGTYRVGIAVSNAFGTSRAVGSVAVTSGIAAQGSSASVNAGLATPITYASFTSQVPGGVAGDYLATIDFGDGTSGPGTILQIGPGQFAVVASHAYPQPGDYTASIAVANRNATTPPASPDYVPAPPDAPATTLITAYAALAASGVSFTTQGNQPSNSTYAFFVDATPGRTAADYAARVDFGDGTSRAGTIRQVGPGQYAVDADHTYASINPNGNTTYLATIFVSAGSGPEVRADSIVTVLPPPPSLSTIVTNTNDSGPGSLRQAMLNANILPGPDIITFQLPTGYVQTIRPASPLPDLTDTTIVDGKSQSRFILDLFGPPLIEIDGRSLPGGAAGLRLADGTRDSRIIGLSIFGFSGPQIALDGFGTFVIGSYVGLRSDGSAPDLSGVELAAPGILVRGASAHIGGSGPGEGNVISGNRGAGVEVRNDVPSGYGGQSTRFLGNIIGLNPAGFAARGNGGDGILIGSRADGFQIGVSNVEIGEGNVISGNGGNGVSLAGTLATSISGAFIGTDVTGTRAIGNAGDGVSIGFRSAFTTIAAPPGGRPNVISGNGSVGVSVQGGSIGTLIANALIGTDVSGTAAVGNGSSGILVTGGASALIGGRNVISGNGSARAGAGIWIEGPETSNVIISGNFIGTDVTGRRRLGNATVGILINGSRNNLIGGIQTSGEPSRNVISGNGQVGVMISGEGATGNEVTGNLIGTDVDGKAAIPNGQVLDGEIVGAGVYINGASGNTIGGVEGFARNVISGNLADGITIFSPQAFDNRILGNFIGTDLAGTARLANGRDGIVIRQAPRNQVAGNVIAGNRRDGVALSGRLTVGNLVASNAIGVDASGRPLPNRRLGIRFLDGALRRRNQVQENSRIPGSQPKPARAPAKVVRVRARAESFGGRGLAAIRPARG
ncbi:virginiamycin B lyase family protein [Tundrisphaera sp. TA3]|uniref:virginiamycin B lyase family protein n=1 Tax=Tundrisphaera sp. TA3 TaxID=3435775 RepID=UPI003EBCD1BE